MAKNYYDIMGLSQNASDKEIKTTYRRLARKYHPDLSKESDAEARFKEMGEAYEVLKDPKKRAQYDEQLKYQDFHARNPHQGSQDAYQYQNYAGDNSGFSEDLFESLFGHRRAQSQAMKGQDYHGSVQISLEDAFHGTERSIQVPTAKGSQTLKVKVPKGVKEGQQIRLAGQGAPGHQGGPAGDIFLTVHVEKHPFFDVMDNDIYLTLPITPWEAALGTTLTVPTLAGKIDLKIPENSQGGQKLRLKQRGLPGKNPGDQYVLLKIVTPPAQNEEAKALYQKMATLMPFNPRASIGV